MAAEERVHKREHTSMKRAHQLVGRMFEDGKIHVVRLTQHFLLGDLPPLVFGIPPENINVMKFVTTITIIVTNPSEKPRTEQ